MTLTKLRTDRSGRHDSSRHRGDGLCAIQFDHRRRRLDRRQRFIEHDARHRRLVGGRLGLRLGLDARRRRRDGGQRLGSTSLGTGGSAAGSGSGSGSASTLGVGGATAGKGSRARRSAPAARPRARRARAPARPRRWARAAPPPARARRARAWAPAARLPAWRTPRSTPTSMATKGIENAERHQNGDRDRR